MSPSFAQVSSLVSQYQYVSVPIPTTPQVIRPKVHYRQHGDTLILPKLIKAIGDRARYTGKVQLTQKMSRSIEHWQQTFYPIPTRPSGSPPHIAWQIIFKTHEQETPKSLLLQHSTANLGLNFTSHTARIIVTRLPLARVLCLTANLITGTTPDLQKGVDLVGTL